MTPGYYRITLRRATRCHHCGAPLPAHAAAWWRPRPAVHERTLCEACYTAQLHFGAPRDTEVRS